MNFPSYLIPFLRTNHAGETGAVCIYKAILLISKDIEVVNFAEKHLKTETEHLLLIERILEKRHRSKLILLWKVAGSLTGFIPSLFGKKTIFATIYFVESFVENHYQEQINMLDSSQKNRQIKNLLITLQNDEISHKEEAIFEAKKFNKLQIFWGKFVEIGSSLAVKISMKI